MVTLMIDVMRSSVTKHASFNRSDPYVRSDVNKDYQPLPLPPVDAVSGSPPLMMYGKRTRGVLQLYGSCSMGSATLQHCFFICH